MKAGYVVCASHSSDGRKLKMRRSWSRPTSIKSKTMLCITTRAKRAEGIDHKHEALSLNPSTLKKEQKKQAKSSNAINKTYTTLRFIICVFLRKAKSYILGNTFFVENC
jgi:hypothetical protein